MFDQLSTQSTLMDFGGPYFDHILADCSFASGELLVQGLINTISGECSIFEFICFLNVISSNELLTPMFGVRPTIQAGIHDHPRPYFS